MFFMPHFLEQFGGTLVEGRSWDWVRYTASADTPGPYWAVAVTPSGKALRCTRPQVHPPTMQYSVTAHWITTSTT